MSHPFVFHFFQSKLMHRHCNDRPCHLWIPGVGKQLYQKIPQHIVSVLRNPW